MNPESGVLTPQEAQECLTPKQQIAKHCLTHWINEGLKRGKRRFDYSGDGTLWGDKVPFFFLKLEDQELDKVLRVVIKRFEEAGWKITNLDESFPIMIFNLS